MEAPVASTAPESGGPQALVSMSNPVCQMETGSSHPSPVKHSPHWHPSSRMFTCSVPHQSPACKVRLLPHQCPSDHPAKRAHAETAEAKVSSGHSTSQSKGELPRTPPEVPNNSMGAFGSTEGHNSKDNTNQGGRESTQGKLRENAADSNLE